ncbi:MAG: hypothetical protein PWP03_711 [Candidatus Woesearchaeota archaeon]|nr:hypothetical protein [Candidatus Woesearchaeota archaeon]MDN5328073.1 hypothetical protein [Candidatus Woesearchaeota archaeon]
MNSEEEIREKYIKKLKESLNEVNQASTVSKVSDFELANEIRSSDYLVFREAMLTKQLSFYEKICKTFGNVIQISLSKDTEDKIKEAIEIAHLNIKPSDAVSFAVLFPLLIAGVIMIASLAYSAVFQKPLDMFLMLSALMLSLALIVVLLKVPEYISKKMQTRASDQMILGVFYIVSFMRHTPNLELAIEFAANHLPMPLSLDFRKILWDLETGKFQNIQDSLTKYLEKWRKTNLEFVEAFNLIQGSLLEGDENRRIELLDKAISVLLEETYEKMLHFAQELKGPISSLHMFGIVMPLLGLVILPLMVGFLGGVYWYHISMLYNIILPLGVFYLTKKFTAIRPAGTSEVDLSFIKQNKPVLLKGAVIALGVIFVLLGLSPIFIHAMLGDNADFEIAGLTFLDYRQADNGKSIGPFGTISTLISILIPLGIALAIAVDKYVTNKTLIKLREQIAELEKEYSSALFQLGNRLADGYPIENAFESVSNIMKGTKAGKFFALISANIKQLGLGVYDSIFNPKVGAIKEFPSNIVESSMKILVQTIKKGPQTAAVAITNIAKYIQEIHRINERLRDLLTEVTSSIRSQIQFIAPIIAGIVVALTSMITVIMGKIKEQITSIASQGGQASQLESLMHLFSNNIPPYHFQIIVGIFLIEMVYIMTILHNAIEKGEDKINEQYWIGNNLLRSITLYSLITFIMILVFSMIASVISLSG